MKRYPGILTADKTNQVKTEKKSILGFSEIQDYTIVFLKSPTPNLE